MVLSHSSPQSQGKLAEKGLHILTVSYMDLTAGAKILVYGPNGHPVMFFMLYIG